MSERIINWALSQVCGAPDIKSVLMMLAHDANGEGRGNIMLVDLARYTDIDPAKLPAILHALENFKMAYANIDDNGVVRYQLSVDRPGKRRK